MLMLTAQQAWDDRAEDYYDEESEVLSHEEAIEIAQGELETTPELIADWLAAECSGAADALNVNAIADRDALKIPQLLAVLFGGNDQQAMVARWELGQRLQWANKAWTNGRADELLAEAE